MCPRCSDGGGGIIHKAQVTCLNLTIYLCDECEAMWLNTPFEYKPGRWYDFQTFMESKGINEPWKYISGLQKEWY
ncbi:MAG: hypothetical protein K0Q73_8296 [Paenibacillus sp.]|jgi:hypothetical protein|nr:hypothetical protein [Paenibacillus sp.]